MIARDQNQTATVQIEEDRIWNLHHSFDEQ